MPLLQQLITLQSARLPNDGVRLPLPFGGALVRVYELARNPPPGAIVSVSQETHHLLHSRVDGIENRKQPIFLCPRLRTVSVMLPTMYPKTGISRLAVCPTLRRGTHQLLLYLRVVLDILPNI